MILEIISIALENIFKQKPIIPASTEPGTSKDWSRPRRSTWSGWRGWHHHMALVLMTMQLMLEQRLQNQKLHPLLSSADIVSLLKYFLPKHVADQEEVFRQMAIRHKKWQAAIDSAWKIQSGRLAHAHPYS